MSSEQAETWTVLKLLEWTTNYFKQNGSESARLDAELLLSEARGCERIELYTAFNEEPNEQVRTAFRELVRRRGEGTPVAYLLGRKEFYSMSFRVNEHTLIPRPETEHLIIEVLDEVKRQNRVDDSSLAIADVGTGSGIIAVCLAKHLPKANVTAVDASAAAIEVAKSNAKKHEVADRVAFQEGDLLASLPAEPSFDFICSNPPYVSQQEYDQLDAEVKDFEPKLALLAGLTGTEIIDRLIPESASRLKPSGHLLIELSPMIADQVVDTLQANSAFEATRAIKDLAGHKRIIASRRST